MHENREVFKARYPKIAPTELSKKFGQAWRLLPNEEKNKYKEEYQKAKQLYDEERKKHQMEKTKEEREIATNV